MSSSGFEEIDFNEVDFGRAILTVDTFGRPAIAFIDIKDAARAGVKLIETGSFSKCYVNCKARSIADKLLYSDDHEIYVFTLPDQLFVRLTQETNAKKARGVGFFNTLGNMLVAKGADASRLITPSVP
jgi:hypothetical protein